MVTLEQALDIVMQLPLEQREMLIDIMHKRHIESRREEIALDASSAIASFHSGKLKPQPVEEIILELRQSIVGLTHTLRILGVLGVFAVR